MDKDVYYPRLRDLRKRGPTCSTATRRPCRGGPRSAAQSRRKRGSALRPAPDWVILMVRNSDICSRRCLRRSGALGPPDQKSRSRLFSDALEEYLARHAPDEVTEAMNRACAEAGQTTDRFVSSAARRILERSEW